MASVKLIALLSIGLIVGLGTGLGAGYVGLNPQINNLQDKLVSTQDKLVAAEAKYGQLLESKEKADSLLQSTLAEKEAKIRALELDIASKSAELATLKSIKADSEKALAAKAALEKEIGDAKAQIVALKAADVKLIGLKIDEKVDANGQQHHIVTGYVINFGGEDASLAKLKITWNEEICPCQFDQIRSETITLSNVKAKSVNEISETYTFKINSAMKRVDTEFTWQK